MTDLDILSVMKEGFLAIAERQWHFIENFRDDGINYQSPFLVIKVDPPRWVEDAC